MGEKDITEKILEDHNDVFAGQTLSRLSCNGGTVSFPEKTPGFASGDVDTPCTKAYKNQANSDQRRIRSIKE